MIRQSHYQQTSLHDDEDETLFRPLMDHHDRGINLVRIVEGSNILEPGQEGFRARRGCDINMHKLDFITRESQKKLQMSSFGSTWILKMPLIV